MSQGFSDDFRETLRGAVSILDLVSETVSLKAQRAGHDYVGLCPFHPDRNPSLHVYPERQSYRCWVCEAGGDIFRWVMETERVSFPEAMESLARRVNLEVPKRIRTGSESGSGSEQRRKNLYSVLDWATSLMQRALRSESHGEIARKYVSHRQLNSETVSTFRLGYHPEDWNWFVDQARGRYTPQELLAAGLIGERSSGQGYYDNLVGRLVFPIQDEQKRVVAFGGRVLPGSGIESPAKYWNSVESGIFHKRRTLYAFDQARESVRRSGTAIVVEGYMDCIACHQAGVTNVVATLGTAMTEDHVRVMKRFAERVVLIYDGDDAGQKAAERSIQRFLAQDLDLRILTLPDGLDPADFLEKQNAEAFQRLIAGAHEAWEYKFQSVLKRTGTGTINGRQQALNQMMDFLIASPGMDGSVREDLILKNICQRIQIDERTARKQLQNLRGRALPKRTVRDDAEYHRNKGYRDTAIPSGGQSVGQTKFPDSVEFLNPGDAETESGKLIQTERALDLAEREVLEILLTCPETIDAIMHHIGTDDFENTENRHLLELCIDIRKEEGDLPEFCRLIAAAESDSRLVSLMNAVMDSAEQKGVLRLMSASPQAHDSEEKGMMPLHLQRVLRPLLERREKRRNLLSRQRLAQTEASASELNDDQKDALRQLYDFRLNQMGNRIHLK
ncbi:MAG: DNA primase [Planctomyces sp.]